jgi:hypothetical protein
MKKLNYLFVLLVSVAILVVACGKDGAVGPQGATGATGSQGAVGAAGPAGVNGQNGSVIYSGTTTPASTVGKTGDFYIDLATGFLYGPKTASGWGAGFSLKGATGATGAAGSKIYNGSGAPVITAGAIGDYYLDKTNYLLYGPKTASGWGVPVNLQGPQGPMGNANVKVDTFSVGGSQWLWNSQYMFETSPGSYTEYFTRYYTRNNNTITQDVLDNGLVLVYFTPSPFNNPNQWAPLPYQFDSSFGFTYNYVYVTALGQVTLHYFFIQTSTTATLPTLSTYNDEVRKFKIVTITGQTGTFMQQHHINLNNYQEVSKITGLWQQDKPF